MKVRGLGAVTITVPHYDSVQTVNGKNIMKMGVEKMFDSRVEKEIIAHQIGGYI